MVLHDLTPAESDALLAYKANRRTGSSSNVADDLNAHLRRGLFVDEICDADIKAVATGLDSALARCPTLTADRTLYRGIGFRQHIPLHVQGCHFRSLEYWSTTTEKASTEAFLKPVGTPGHGAILTLQVPAGTPAYDMETLLGAGGGESELLLPRGMVWEVGNFEITKGRDIAPFLQRYFETIANVSLTAVPYTPPRS